MKKIIISTILLIGIALPTYAQEDELPTEPGGEEVQIQIQEENDDAPDQQSDSEEEVDTAEQESEESTLSEDLQITQQSSIGFWSILFATITPALLIVIAYLLIKMANT